LEESGNYKIEGEDLEELFAGLPDDVDTEFGPGFTQLEDDEEIVDAHERYQARARENADRAREERGRGGEEKEGRKPARKQSSPADGDESEEPRAAVKKSSGKKPRPAVEEE